MKRLVKLMVALGMAIIMVAGTLSIAAFAATEKQPYGSYKYYTYIGDSIPFGYGLVSQEESSDPFSVGNRVKGSYPDLIGAKLEKTNKKMHVQPSASSGSRLCDYRILLERGMGIKNPYNRENDWYGNRKPERTVRLRAMGPEICGWIQQSDLITFQLGINDITGLLINSAYATGLIDLDKLQSLGGLDDVLAYLEFAVGNLAKDSDILGNFIRTFQSELNGILVNAQVVVKDIQLLAPNDADIVLIGYHMAAQGLRVIPGTNGSVIFDIVDSVLEALNTVFKVEADKYDNVYYCAAPDAEVFYPVGTTAFECLQDTSKILWGVHPNAKGHQYIAKMVLKKLKEINA